MEAPPVLTAERIDAMLSIMAEVCLEGVVEAGGLQKAAEDPDSFERGGRAVQRACRNLRQTIAMKHRHDREQALHTADARKLAEARRAEAERIYRHRVEQAKAALNRHFERVLWNELERPDAEELFDELRMRVKDAAHEDDFLEVPLEDHVARFAHEIGILAPPRETPAPATLGEASSAVQLPSAAEDAETARLRALSEPSATSAVENGACGAHRGRPQDRAALLPVAEAPPPEPPAQRPAGAQPPPRPPDPYIPPWERLRPGQRVPGGAGW